MATLRKGDVAVEQPHRFDKRASSIPASRLVTPVLGFLLLLLLLLSVELIVDVSDAFEGASLTLIVLAAGIICCARAAYLRAERLAWAMLGVGVFAWGLGNLYYTLAFFGLEEAPFPSLADLGYLLFYPFAYVGLVLLLRSRTSGAGKHLAWIDGLIGALAFASVGVAVLLPAVLSATEGPPATVATNLAYPLGDLTLLSLLVGSYAAAGWQSLRALGLLTAGLILFAVGDSAFLYLTAKGGYVHGAILDLTWPAAALLIAAAAWRPIVEVRHTRPEGWRAIAVPLAFGLLAIVIEAYDHFARLHLLAIALATAALLAVLARLAITFSDYVGMLQRSRVEASTDALTGLGNRRQLASDLERNLARVDEGHRCTLALFDLDGFKQYNDTFGHSAGDALLARLGARLRDAVGERGGSAYRMGGDEFCIVVEVDGDAGLGAVEAAAAALSEHGDSFELGASYGVVALPIETSSPSEALRLADHRMYVQKSGRRGSVTHQATDVLLRALTEAHPGLGEHPEGVAALTEATARWLGLSNEEVEKARLTAMLHDVGKMAIPEAILEKAGPLSEEEWKFVKRHTIIGERIISAAPALNRIARGVRATHERWDGGGYPDGLRAEEIPLISRIVFVCDAFDAMTSSRPYCEPRTDAEAEDEIRRHAGTQFDPAVVEAFLHLRSEQQSAAERGRGLA